MAKEEITPMMKQFYDFKAKYPDALLLFRCGDFYETYADDAVIAADILGITLTKRGTGGTERQTNTAMAGFPYHALDNYLPRLIRAGKRVAICDQLEDPKLTKKLVKRGVTEIVTPGVAMDDGMLRPKRNNFLAAVHIGRNVYGVAFLDISTGEFLVAEGITDYIDKLLTNFAPNEVLCEEGKRVRLEASFGTKQNIYALADWVFNDDTARAKVLNHFGVKNLKGFGIEHLTAAITAAGAILYYLEQTQHTNISHIRNITQVEEERYVRLDKFTIRSLELLSPMNEGGMSLLDVIDHTISPMGGRLMRRWVVFPLKDTTQIRERQRVVEHFFRNTDLRDIVETQLANVCDIERVSSKIAVGRISPRDYLQLRAALEAIEPIKAACEQAGDPGIQKIGRELDACTALRQRIEHEIRPDAPLLISKGNVIADGVSTELDELRAIAYSGKDYLLQMQNREIERTGIQSLKIGFNNVFGYYMEVRNTFKHLVPPEWIRKQTLVQAERYITQELKEYEDKILGAEERISALENQLFAKLVADSAAYIPQLQKNSSQIARLDCLLSFALTAKANRYACPVVDDSLVIDIKGGRHPVIEHRLPPGEAYVANNLYIDPATQQILIITGPNMAGKSALLRQTALITILAQIGCFVPAESAHIGIADKIFTRVGASDNISLGESTFMVEMTEAASILNNLSERSLILFDELGRGTSTYDGISIAWAIIEYIHENARNHARTLFATHYHELNEMERLFTRVKNFNVSVKEADNKVIFIRKLVPGGSEHSFGIHVAKIAGMVPSVVKRAEQVLRELERNNSGDGISRPPTQTIHDSGTHQLSFFQLDDPILSQVRDEILNIDVNALTPLEALNKLNDIKKILNGK